MSTAKVECKKCARLFSDMIRACPFCGTRRDGKEGEPRGAPAGKGVADNAAASPTSRPPPVAISNDSLTVNPLGLEENVCPRCGGTVGTHSVVVCTRELVDVQIIRGRRKYLVRTWNIDRVCSPCFRVITRGRYFADFLCLTPLVLFFVLLVVSESRFMLAVIVLYLIYLASNLNYNWADRMLYGNGEFEERLDRLVKEGDAGTLTLPVGAWHCAIRVLGLPVLFYLFASILMLWAASGQKSGPVDARTETNVSIPNVGSGR